MHGIPAGSFPGTFEAYQQDIHPDDRDLVLGTVQKNIETASEHVLLYRIIRPTGEVRWLEAHGRFDVDERGAPRRLIGVCSDVTDRVNTDAARLSLVVEQTARREAEQAASRTQQILGAIADVFVVCRQDWTVAFVNQAGARMLGGEPAQVLGTNLWAIPTALTGSTIEHGLRRAMLDRAVATLEDRIGRIGRIGRIEPMGPTGPTEALEEWVEVTAYPLPDGGLAIYAHGGHHRSQGAGTAQSARERRRGAQGRGRRRHGSRQRTARDAPKTGAARGCESRHLPMAFARIWLLDASRQWLELFQRQRRKGCYYAPRRRARPRSRRRAQDRPHRRRAPPAPDERRARGRRGRGQGVGARAKAWSPLRRFSSAGQRRRAARRPGRLLQGAAARQDTLDALAGASDAIAQGIQRRRSELALAEPGARSGRGRTRSSSSSPTSRLTISRSRSASSRATTSSSSGDTRTDSTRTPTSSSPSPSTA